MYLSLAKQTDETQMNRPIVLTTRCLRLTRETPSMLASTEFSEIDLPRPSLPERKQHQARQPLVERDQTSDVVNLLLELEQPLLLVSSVGNSLRLGRAAWQLPPAEARFEQCRVIQTLTTSVLGQTSAIFGISVHIPTAPCQ